MPCPYHGEGTASLPYHAKGTEATACRAPTMRKAGQACPYHSEVR